MRTLGLAPSEFWGMTPPELMALTAAMPRGKFLTRDQLGDLHKTMKEHGMFDEESGGR